MEKDNRTVSIEKYKDIRANETNNEIQEINIGKILKSSTLNEIEGAKYETIKAIVPLMNGSKCDKYYVTCNGIPLFQVNEWLNIKNRKINTGKKYANIMIRFLNYLNSRKIEYWDATSNNVEDYILFILYGKNELTTLIEANVRYKTIKDDIGVIKQFYMWLSKRIKRVRVEHDSNKTMNDNIYPYQDICEDDYYEILNKHLESMPATREYIKWYNEEQKEVLSSNFNTLRDKAIFRCTLDGGMRIDEVISIKLTDYNSKERSVKPSRSKNKNGLRVISLSEETCRIINNYMMTERSDAESESGVYSEYLFINIKSGENQGKEISYPNYYKIFKKCAKRAGFDISKIRTHSGRSTKTMELLEYQAMYPEDKITDAEIMTIMGWGSSQSINAYRDHRNKTLGKLAQEKIRRRKDKEDEH